METSSPILKKSWCVKSRTGNIEDYYEINNKTVHLMKLSHSAPALSGPSSRDVSRDLERPAGAP